jgi:hypothetical protein
MVQSGMEGGMNEGMDQLDEVLKELQKGGVRVSSAALSDLTPTPRPKELGSGFAGPVLPLLAPNWARRGPL